MKKSREENIVFMKQKYAKWSIKEKLKYWESKLIFLDKMQTQVNDGIGNFGLYIMDIKNKNDLLQYEDNWEKFETEYCKYFGIDLNIGRKLFELKGGGKEWIELAKKVGCNY